MFLSVSYAVCAVFSCFLSCFLFCLLPVEHHQTRLVCENERLRLICKNNTVLAIYSATFGHLLHGSPYCPLESGSHADMGQKQGALCVT